jgi:hypothetical protein
VPAPLPTSIGCPSKLTFDPSTVTDCNENILIVISSLTVYVAEPTVVDALTGISYFPIRLEAHPVFTQLIVPESGDQVN